MKNIVTSLLGLVFLIVGCNIANVMGYNPPTNLQTVAASTVPQLPLSNMFNNRTDNNPDTVIVRETYRDWETDRKSVV